jgi:hypothetical protein
MEEAGLLREKGNESSYSPEAVHTTKAVRRSIFMRQVELWHKPKI